MHAYINRIHVCVEYMYEYMYEYYIHEWNKFYYMDSLYRNNFFCFAFFKTLFFSFFYFFLNCVAWSVTQARYYRYCRRLPLPRELQFFQTNIFRNSFFNKRYLKKLNDGQIPFWRSPQHQLFVQPFSYPWHIWLSWQQWFYRQPCVWHRLCVVVLRQQQ